jgi:calcineurin-like phosphoesterase family protein
MDEHHNQVVAICKERNMYQLLSTSMKTLEKQYQDVDVVWFLLDLKLEYESICAQILGGSKLPLDPKFFSQIQRATLSDHSSQLSF